MRNISAIELLAPAGSAAALHAGVCAGADAVYLGLESFNARRGADNFTMPAFREACAYAHLRGVRVYVTMNIEILPGEWNAAMECARQAWRAGADAFIVQDIGLAAAIKRAIPEARLHISTQMNTTNAAGLRAAAALGASRVTLARELNLDEIRVLAAQARELGMEVEVFAHGALCVCYSGQCLMSSMIGGRSANRGTCAQACRLPYELYDVARKGALPAPGEYLLSPKDLCTVDMLGDLVDAGVASLKIEGRMKSPEYVSAVVGVYRAVLDRVLAEGRGAAGATPAEQQVLAEAFSRGFTHDYLLGKRGNDMMSYQRPNNRGISVGRVESVNDKGITIRPTKTLHAGDVLEIWTGKGRATVTVADAHPQKNGLVSVPFGKLDREARAVRAADRVFRVRSAEAQVVDDALEPRVPVDMLVELHLGSPARIEAWTLTALPLPPLAGAPDAAGEGEAGQGDATTPRAFTARARVEGGVVERARTRAVSAEDVRAHIDRMGSTPFVLHNITVQLDEDAGIGFGELHQLRAQVLDALAGQMLAPYGNRVLAKTAEKRSASAGEFSREPQARRTIIAAWATNPACARAAKRAGADVIYVPALNAKRGEGVIAGQLSSTADSAGYPKTAVVALPTVEHDMLWSEDGLPLTREAARSIDVFEQVQAGHPVYADSFGSIVRACEMGAQVEVGSHVPVTNTHTLDDMAHLGVTRVWLSPELTLRQIAELSGEGQHAEDETVAPPVPLGITIIGRQELMITEHCMLMSQGSCTEDCAHCPRRKSPHVLSDRKDMKFPVVTDSLGRSHIYNSVQLDIAHALPDLLRAGVSAFMVDTTFMNTEEVAQAVGRAVRARNLAENGGASVDKVAGATTGHLFRAVQ